MTEIQNDSGLPLKPVYSAEDRNGEEPLPGSFPFTRGIRKDMYRGRLWTMRQYAGFGTAAESNKRYRFLLQQGQTGLSVAFDLPTQIGYDSDDPMAHGEVGKVGVAIDSLEDMEILLRDIPLDEVSTSMTINATAAMLLLLYQLVAEKQGVRAARVVLLRVPHGLLRRGRQVSRRAPDVGATDARSLPREGRTVASAALSHPDRRRHADRAAAAEQRGAHDSGGDERRARRHA